MHCIFYKAEAKMEDIDDLTRVVISYEGVPNSHFDVMCSCFNKSVPNYMYNISHLKI